MSEKEALEIALKKIQGIWCETFGIKDLNEDFIPHLKDEVKEYLQSDIHLKIGSLLKLIQKDRLSFIDKIKPTIEEPNLVLDNHQGILFIKEFIDIDKNRYFMSVAKNYDGEWIFASHTKREFKNIQNEIERSKVIYNKGFQCSEVAGACDILESGGEVSKPSHLQIKYTANQDFGRNPENIIPQNHNSSCSRFKNQLKNIGENLIKDREKLKNAQELQDSKTDTQSHKSHLRKQK
ncbi:PBECR2 nuclease fold domain-containing protein [Helicobacter rodentium]|uniref:PBECR2 nuclease fold domain-containing protein n=2 Tax=Helicobacteraceae TaxID=72293 RepID=UPI0023F516F8|nr:PBECR2 nuclease fold domain-containing protein [Helicobacter rodentium]